MPADKINYSDTLRIGTDKINDAIEVANKAEVDSTNAVSTAGNAVATANTANTKSDVTQAQLDTIVIESGTSDAEILQARTDVSGTTYPLIKDRMNAVDSQLSENTKDAAYVLKGSGIDHTGNTLSTGVQAFFDKVAQEGGGVISIPFGLYRFNTALNYYPDKITLVAARTATFQFEQATGYCIEIKAYETLYVKDYLEQALMRSVTGIKFKALNNAVYLLRSKGAGISGTGKFASGWKFKDCSFIGGNSIEISTDTWCTMFDHCYFKPTGGYGVYMPTGGSNYGERISVHGCIFDGATTAIYNDNSSGDIHITQTSIDYCHNAITVNGGIVSIDESFVESSFTDMHWFIAEGYGATLNIGFIQIVDTYNGTRPLELFKVQDDSTDLQGSGIYAEHIKLTTGISSPTFLVKGTGRAIFNKVDGYKDSKKQVISRFMNKLAFGHCNTADSISEWDAIAGSIAPTLDTTTFYQGTGSMKFSRTGVGNVATRITIPCQAGDAPRMKFHMKSQNIQTNALAFLVDYKFLNAKGTTITNGNMKTINTDFAAWTEQAVIPNLEAPQGTSSIQITLWCGNWTDNVIAWLDDIVINMT